MTFCFPIYVGFIDTDMTSTLNRSQLEKMIPLGRFGDANEVAKTALFLAKTPYITGQVCIVLINIPLRSDYF